MDNRIQFRLKTEYLEELTKAAAKNYNSAHEESKQIIINTIRKNIMKGGE